MIAPFAGARIETDFDRGHHDATHKSLPSRGRGLKPGALYIGYRAHGIAPFAGARIETLNSPHCRLGQTIAPFAGARIETEGIAHG